MERYEEDTVSLLDVYRDHYEPGLQESTIRRFLAAPIAIRIREEKEKELKKLSGEK